jgi:hypothetical protein
MSDFRIVYTDTSGTLCVVIPAPLTSVDEAARAVPEGLEYTVIGADELPAERTFRKAWVLDQENTLSVDLSKAKAIAHDKRREIRAEMFSPFDAEIAKQIPGESAAIAEVARQQIRQEFAQVQVSIDVAKEVDELSVILEGLSK